MALIGGVVAAVATDAVWRSLSPSQLSPSQKVPAAALGLVTAAVIYPAARLRRPTDPAIARREWRAVGATTAVLALSTRHSRRLIGCARTAVAAGWVGHAIFDNVHDRGPASRLPDWYPAVCAGYDIALAGLLLRR